MYIHVNILFKIEHFAACDRVSKYIYILFTYVRIQSIVISKTLEKNSKFQYSFQVNRT